MVGKYIHDSQKINSQFDCRYINMALASSLDDIGKASFRKAIDYFRLVRKILREAKTFNPDLFYVTPNANGNAFYKDYLIVQLLKRKHRPIIVHYHNKGVSQRHNKLFDNLLYKRFFKNLKVILLAEPLYEDVKKYVRREDVMFCPNGIPDMLNTQPHEHFVSQ